MGAKSGTSPGNAKPFSSLNSVISSLSSTGGEVLLLANKGIYNISSSMNISSGGSSSSKPVVVKTYRASAETSKAILRGTRVSPWVNKSSSQGKEFLRLMSGADHLHFEDLQFENFGNGIFRIAKPIKDLQLRRIRAVNFTRLVENYLSGSGSNASVNGLVMQDIEGFGYTRGLVRLKYSSQNVLISRVVGDSQGQLDKDDFPMGIALHNSVSAVTVQKALMKNHRQNLGNSSKYYNGDGVATESNVKDVRIVDTVSSGNSDGGFDLKSTETVLVRTYAHNNKRNFRFWNPASVYDSKSVDPQKFGGSGNKVHVGTYGSRNFQVKFYDVDILDTDSNARVFSLGENQDASISVDGGVIRIEGTADLVDSAGRLSISSDTVLDIP